MSDNSTDFGFQTVPLAAKKPMVRAVFDSVAPRYDLMNDLMSLGVHRAWKRDFVAALQPRPNKALLDLAGGTGDITFGWHRAGGGPAILSDINAAMLDVGRDRAIARGFGGITYLVADAEALPLPDRSVDVVSIGVRPAQRHRQGGGAGRGTPGAAAWRALRLPGILPRAGVAALAPVYDAWSFRVLPRLGKAVAGDADSYQYWPRASACSRTRRPSPR